MFEGMGDMSKMLEGMQEAASKMEAETANKEYSVKTGGGMVKVTMNGKGETTDLEIDDSLMDDKESLQILLMSAMNDVSKMVEDGKKQSAMGMLGGLGGANPFGNK